MYPLFGIPLPMCVINKTHICKAHLNDSRIVLWWDLSRVEKCYSCVSFWCFSPSFWVVVRCKIASTWYEGVKNAPFDRQREGKTLSIEPLFWSLVGSLHLRKWFLFFSRIFIFWCLPSPPLLLLLVDFSHDSGCQMVPFFGPWVPWLNMKANVYVGGIGGYRTCMAISVENKSFCEVPKYVINTRPHYPKLMKFMDELPK